MRKTQSTYVLAFNLLGFQADAAQRTRPLVRDSLHCLLWEADRTLQSTTLDF